MNLAPGLAPLKMEKLIPKVFQFWKHACARGFAGERTLWH